MRLKPHLALVVAVCGALADSAAGNPGVPPLLDATLRKMGADQGHWACTWNSVYTFSQGHPQGMTSFSSDPSQPYGEQWRPLLMNGRPPTEKVLESFRQAGEKKGQELDRKQNDSAESSAYRAHMTLDYNIMDQQAVAYYDEAAVASADANTVFYDVPLHSSNPVPFDVWSHFHLIMRINRHTANIERVTILLRKPLWPIKVRHFQIDAEYRMVNPAFPAVPVVMHAEFYVSVLFKKYYFAQDCTWTEYRRVTPYGDHFKVRIGPLKSIGF
jgi:hypothetical protein